MAVHLRRNRALREAKQEPASPHVREYFQPSTKDEPQWQSKPEIPSAEEVLGSDTPDGFVVLTPNLIDQPWPSREKYLECHYKLLREDSVAPLRDAVAMVRNDPTRTDGKDFSVYESVFVTGITLARPGLALRLRFSTRRAGKNILWSDSDRLRPGTIIALTPEPDGFSKRCMVAIVASRILDNVLKDPPEVDIYLPSYTDLDLDPQQEWIMVEARAGYYEASRHTMTALQKLYTESFPLSEKICNLNTDIGIPNYVKTQPMRGFRSLSQVPDREANKCDILQQWPPSPMGILDDSQWLALREMITKELAIIQGPPGTGKTFTSLAALKFMLENKGPDDPPIVIAAQTNHALDQLIKQVAEFEKNYVRMGSRSTESEIRKHTLFELRRENLVPRVTGGVWQAGKQQHKRLAKVIAEVLKPLTQVNSDQPLKAAMLLEYGLLRQDQVDSLIKKARDWERGGTVTDPLHAWLGTTVTEFRYPYTGNFGFDNDERVLEYEQLREIEMENGGHEEDWAALKDHFISIATGFCGESEDQIPLSKMRSYLEETDLWKVPRRYRGIIYDYFRKQVIAIVLENFSRFREEYEDCTEKFHLGRCERDYPALRDTNLIGLTTTGLSKYRAVLASVKPRVILIEEAAEVIEAPVAVACLPSLQQLILVGDHRQLRGRCAVDELSMAPFNLEVSMFERLVDNGMGFTMLQEQRRMIPEIRQLVAPLYGNTLRDHASVGDRPLIPGMGELRSYFFQHTSHESNDSLSSYFNEFEASMVIGLLGHLLKNRVPPTHITILTFYQGQRKLIKRKQDKNIDTVHHVQIATVDAYQGEENDIILLSLVRSNEHRGIGFLQQINRACVALSRAKSGLFIFGNAKCIVGYNPFWKTVIDQMRKAMPCRIGRALPLFCDRHDVQTLIKNVADWDKIDGGCDEPCGEDLPCGHPCPRKCHKSEHDWISCKEPCLMFRRECNDPCIRRCAPPHIHQCRCTLFDDPKKADPIGYNYDTIPEKSDFESGAQHSEATTTPFRGRSPTPRTLPVRARPTIHESPSKKYDEGVKRWRYFAKHGAREDDYRRAGIPLPPDVRPSVPSKRPEPVTRKPAAPVKQEVKKVKPSILPSKKGLALDDLAAEGSQPTVDATTKSEGQKEAEPVQKEVMLIDFD